MTRKEEIARASNEYHLKRLPNFTFGEYVAFIDGAQWADQHQHWISVEDEEPPKGQWIITYEPTSPIVIGSDFILPDETADEHHITHWMPMPQAPKKGGEE